MADLTGERLSGRLGCDLGTLMFWDSKATYLRVRILNLHVSRKSAWLLTESLSTTKASGPDMEPKIEGIPSHLLGGLDATEVMKQQLEVMLQAARHKQQEPPRPRPKGRMQDVKRGGQSNLDIGSAVEVKADPPLYGVIRWIGQVDTPRGGSVKVAGIELV